jgi:hypothetical protein
MLPTNVGSVTVPKGIALEPDTIPKMGMIPLEHSAQRGIPMPNGGFPCDPES